MLKSTQDFSDMLPVIIHVIGINQDIVEIDDNRDIKHVSKDVIHEVLEGHRSIGESFNYAMLVSPCSSNSANIDWVLYLHC